MQRLPRSKEIMKHTPGKWTVKRAGYIGSYYIKEFVDRVESSDLKDFTPIGEEDEANANLISAAPDMYEALKNLIKRDLIKDKYDTPTGFLNDHYAEVTQAIKQAEGE